MNQTNKTEPLVSIGIPSYNRVSSIERTIKSIVNQTYKNLEIIISDNCSTDKKIDYIIDFYCEKDPRIIYKKQEKNLGATKNFSFLLDIACGEYFMWMADDDYISIDYVEKIMNSFDENREYTLIGGQGYFVDPYGKKIKNETMCIEMEKSTERFMTYLNAVQSNSIFYGIFRKNDVDKYNMDFYGSDWLHVARLAYKGKIKVLEDIFVYRDNTGVSNQKYTYPQLKSMYFTVSKEFERDILESKLYNNLSDSDLKNLINLTQKSILKRSPSILKYANQVIRYYFVKIIGREATNNLKILFQNKLGV